MRRAALVVALASLGIVAGAGTMLRLQDGNDDPPEASRVADSEARPEADRTVPTVTGAPLPEPTQARLLVSMPRKLDPDLVQAAQTAPGVEAASVVRGDIVNLVASRDADGRTVDQTDDGWALPLDAIAVDSASHAQFAATADRSAVANLRDGEALLSRTSAELRELGPGATLDLLDGQRLVVTAVVDDASIGAAELAVTASTGSRIGIDQPRYALMTHDGDRAALEATLRTALSPGAQVKFRAPGETPFLRNSDAVLPPLLLKQQFGEFAYQPPSPDRREFRQDPAWQAENLVDRDMPIVGPMRCHRAVVDALESALREIESDGLASLVDPAGYAGCWNSRLIAPGGDLSHHAWGVAFDINYGTNPTGLTSVQDPRLVEVLERWGFTWGGDWLVPDPAHFEYLEPPRR